MTTLVPDFRLPGKLADRVDSYRLDKIDRLNRVLASLPGGTDYDWAGLAGDDLPLRYALAHHVFENASRAAQAGDPDALYAALRLRKDQSSLLPGQARSGPVLIAHPGKSDLLDDRALAEAPVALLSEAVCATADDTDRKLVLDALGTAVDAGFGDVVSRNCRVVTLIAERRPTDTTIRSWTTNALPATMHLDYFAEHQYVSRDVIHESAHTALNDLFSALDETFPSDVTFYAPWLDTHRPVFGFLHGTWAFCHVSLYCRWLSHSDSAPGDVRALSAAMHVKYAEHMHLARKDADSALGMVKSAELAAAIRAIRDEVLDSYSPSDSAQ